MDAILQVENLTKQYSGFTLDHVSFSVPKGTIMGLIGENVPRYEQETGSLFRHLQLWRELYT